MLHWYELFFIGLLSLQDYSFSLRLVEVRIPNYVIKGSAAQLECLYDLDGESLYSVKWYKDGNEFYRYVPRDIPPAQTFLLPGVSVDVHNSSDAIVTLREVTLQSAGRFRCEVSGEAPSFKTVTEQGDMIVVSLPDQGPPKISGGRPRYQIGDWVRINCTAGRSKPAVQLSWFINGEAADPHFLRGYDIIVSGRESLETSVLGLQFRVEQHHFRNGDMKLKCVASLSTFYWRSNEESVEGDRPQKAPVLESRETVYASNSRADPVQASKTDSLLLNKNINLFILLVLATIITTYGGCGFDHIYLPAIILKNPINNGEKQTNMANSLIKIKVNKQEKKISFNHPARPTILETKKNTTRQDKQRKPLGKQQKQQQKQRQQQQKPCQDCIHQSHYENSAKLEQSESQFNEEMSVRLQAIFLLLVFLLLPLLPPLISLPFNNVQSSPSSAAHTTSVSVAKLTNNSTLYYNRINGIRHAPTNAPHHQINYSFTMPVNNANNRQTPGHSCPDRLSF